MFLQTRTPIGLQGSLIRINGRLPACICRVNGVGRCRTPEPAHPAEIRNKPLAGPLFSISTILNRNRKNRPVHRTPPQISAVRRQMLSITICYGAERIRIQITGNALRNCTARNSAMRLWAYKFFLTPHQHGPDILPHSTANHQGIPADSGRLTMAPFGSNAAGKPIQRAEIRGQPIAMTGIGLAISHCVALSPPASGCLNVSSSYNCAEKVVQIREIRSGRRFLKHGRPFPVRLRHQSPASSPISGGNFHHLPLECPIK